MSTDLAALPASASNLRSRLRRGITLNLIGAVFGQGSTFVFNIAAANLLGRETFGKYGMVASTLTTLSHVAQFACGFTVTKYVAEYRFSDKKKAERIMGTLLVTIIFSAGIVALGLLAITPWLANSVLKAPELRTGLAIGSGIVFLNVLMGFFMGALAGLEAYGNLSRALVLYGIFYLIVCTMATLSIGLNGAFGGLLLSSLFGCILLRLALKSECRNQGIRIQYVLSEEWRSILLGYAFPAATSGLTFLPAVWLGSTILVRQPQGYGQMALFSAAYTLMTAVLFIPNITQVVGWSLLNHQKGQGQVDLYRSMFRMNLVIACAAVTAGALALTVLGPMILRLFGKNFAEGYTVLLIMLAAAIPQAIALVVLQHLQSQERMWLSFFSVVLPRDVLLLALAYYLVPHRGAVGLASAYAGAWMVALLITLKLVFRVRFGTIKLNTP